MDVLVCEGLYRTYGMLRVCQGSPRISRVCVDQMERDWRPKNYGCEKDPGGGFLCSRRSTSMCGDPLVSSPAFPIGQGMGPLLDRSAVTCVQRSPTFTVRLWPRGGLPPYAPKRFYKRMASVIEELTRTKMGSGNPWPSTSNRSDSAVAVLFTPYSVLPDEVCLHPGVPIAVMFVHFPEGKL